MSKILTVDDIEENRYYLKALLKASGHEVVEAKDGAEALNAALADPPNLVISDILMPRMDGFTLCQRWRGEPKLTRIPFIFYTATYTDPKDKELGLSLGADAFLLKPLEPDALLKIVQSLLQHSEAGLFSSTVSPSEVKVDLFLKEYNAALIRKLEDKLAQLEIAKQKSVDAEEFVRAILDNSPLPIVAADADGRTNLVNSAFSAIFGYSFHEAVGKSCFELIGLHENDSEATLLMKQTAGEIVSPHNVKRRCKDGAVIDVEMFLGSMKIHDKTTSLIAIYRDVTEQRKLEEQLRQAQKLEVIGQFAAGMAHDLNNLLGVMVGYSELIHEGVEPQSLLSHHADQIRQACTRAAALTKQLLAFSRRQVLRPEVIDLGLYIEEMTLMLRRLVREDIDLTCTINPPVGHIRMDPVQIEQVVLNLISNASDAMPKGGRLRLELANVKTEAGREDAGNLPKAGDYVRLSVIDTGNGMDEGTLSRIFEPFFTTKPKEIGTGLGLASVHNIVKQNGGEIRVSSQPGKGSCFEVYFPRINEPTSLPSQPAKLSLCSGSETILVVEDEEALRLLITEMLSRIGYRVLPASSADDAARIIQNKQEPIDLLITDIVMPGMGGHELSELVWSCRPEMRVLYISGYAAEYPVDKESSRQQTYFLAKPFTQIQLGATIRRILDRKQPQASSIILRHKNMG